MYCSHHDPMQLQAPSLSYPSINHNNNNNNFLKNQTKSFAFVFTGGLISISGNFGIGNIFVVFSFSADGV
jgi:hypothetical protein